MHSDGRVMIANTIQSNWKKNKQEIINILIFQFDACTVNQALRYSTNFIWKSYCQCLYQYHNQYTHNFLASYQTSSLLTLKKNCFTDIITTPAMGGGTYIFGITILLKYLQENYGYFKWIHSINKISTDDIEVTHNKVYM
jgi:hypothetical protein